MTRLRAILCGLACMLVAACAQDPLPNILIAVSDDQSWNHTGAGGDPVVPTPALDRVAAEGVWFENAFSPAPSCSPSRAATLTGRQIWELGAAANLIGPLDSSYVVFPDLLESAGYHVGFTGKGWGPGDVSETGRERNPAGNEFNTGGQTNYVKNFEAFLDAKGPNQPFYFWFGSHDPHVPHQPDFDDRERLDLNAVTLPPFLPDTPAVRERMLDYYAEIMRFDRHLQAFLDILDARGELDNTIIIVTSDNGIDFPRGKLNLYDYGSRVPLAIRAPNVKTPGRTSRAFVSLIDIAPTILEAARVASHDELTGRSMIPLLEKVSVPAHFDAVFIGRERHSPYREKMRSYPSRAIRTAEFLYIRNFAPDRWPAGDPPYYADSGARGLFVNKVLPEVTEAHALFQLAYAKRPEEELYDLRNDPNQIINVATDPQYDDTRNRLWDRLRNHLRETQDPRERGEDGGWDTMPWTRQLRFPVQGTDRRSR